MHKYVFTDFKKPQKAQINEKKRAESIRTYRDLAKGVETTKKLHSKLFHPYSLGCVVCASLRVHCQQCGFSVFDGADLTLDFILAIAFSFALKLI